MEELAPNSTDPTVAEPPMGDDTEAVVNLPAEIGESRQRIPSLNEQTTCNDTITRETLGADMVGLVA